MAALDTRGARAAAALVALCIVLQTVLLLPHAGRVDDNFDAVHMYFPIARELREQGLHFFLTERSIEFPPLDYIYPALMHLSIAGLSRFHVALAAVTLLLAADAARLMHSPRAGVLCALVFALSPLLHPFLATAVTEPPFLFFCAAWIWSFARWRRTGRPRFAWAGAVALLLALLTRGAIFYWLPVVIVALAVAAARARFDRRDPTTQALIAYAIAALVPLALIAKNWVLFRFPFFATGSGNALYQGNHLVMGGYDPHYVGLDFDVGAIARDQWFVTLEAERLLGGVGRMLIAQSSLGDLLAMYARKLLAFFFVTNAEPGAAFMRAWRIATLALFVPGVLQIRDRWLRAALVGVPAYLTAVHIPVLYTFRYSASSLDLWLTIGAGIGLAAVSAWPWRRAVAFAAVVAAGIAAGFACTLYGGLPQPDFYRGPRLPEWRGEPMQKTLDAGAANTIEMPVGSQVRFYDWNEHVLSFTAAIVPASGRGCTSADVSYRSAPDGAWRPLGSVPLASDAGEHRHVVRGIPFTMRERQGTLRLAFHCETGATLELRSIEIFSPVAAIGWRERLLHEKPLFDVPLED